jgi:hypothetical protein
MNLEKAFNELIPSQFGGEMDKELLQGCIVITELAKVVAIQEYLQEHGSNDEKVNSKERQLRKDYNQNRI